MNKLSVGRLNRVVDFLASFKIELDKVVWPTPKVTLKLTVIVIIVTLIVGFFVGGIDYLLTQLLTLILANK